MRDQSWFDDYDFAALAALCDFVALAALLVGVFGHALLARI
jgi:hypothetical protein